MTTISISPAVTLETVNDWAWTSSPDHNGRVPIVTMQERQTFSALMDLERLTVKQVALREAIRRKISFRISREIGW